MRNIDWFHAAATTLVLLTAMPIRADIPPPDRPVRLVADAAHSPALMLGLAVLVLAGLGIFLYRRQRK